MLYNFAKLPKAQPSIWPQKLTIHLVLALLHFPSLVCILKSYCTLARIADLLRREVLENFSEEVPL